MREKDYFVSPIPIDAYKELSLEYQSMLLDMEKNIPFFTISSPKHSILNVEMFWVFFYIVKIKPSLFFESGFYKGRSTLILLETIKRFSHGTELISVGKSFENEMNIISNLYPNASIVVGDGFDVAKKLPKDKDNIGVLIDGPKMKDIVKFDYCIYRDLFNYKGMRFIFQHDVSPLGNEINRYVFEAGYNKYFKDKNIECYIIDQTFEQEYMFLDVDLKKFIPRNIGLYVKRDI